MSITYQQSICSHNLDENFKCKKCEMIDYMKMSHSKIDFGDFFSKLKYYKSDFHHKTIKYLSIENLQYNIKNNFYYLYD